MAEIKLHTKFYSGEDIINAILNHMEAVGKLPTADVVEVVRCVDCIHRPFSTDFAIEAPDCVCPCSNSDDDYYSWIPSDDFFCASGERKEGGE